MTLTKVTAMINNIIAVVHEVWVSGMAAIVTYVILFPIRSAWQSVGERFKNAMDTLNAVHQELITQRTNCLATLQQEGEKQTEVLKEISNTLTDIHVDQSRTLGIIEGRG